MPSEVFMITGFLLASYSIVANDAIQTLGTFLSSNANRKWWVLWLYASSILTVVLILGWVLHHGDVSYGRLSKIPVPERFEWFHVVPPLVLLVLTRYGMPVSTTFLILAFFAPKALGAMLIKSLCGYAVAFVVSIVVYMAVTKPLEKRFIDTAHNPPQHYWIVLQWMSTAFLWSQWLIQDLANTYVYLQRDLPLSYLFISLLVMLMLIGFIFYHHGGKIQKIVTSKTNTQDIRSATIVDFIYGLVLFLFKEVSHMPMSTTWVFLGLLAGRELAIVISLGNRTLKSTASLVFSDVVKASIGLIVSVLLALGLPLFRDMF